MQVIVLPRHSWPGLLCKSQPAVWAKDNVMFKCFGCFPPPTSAEGEKPSYQHCSCICKHSSLGKIWGLQKLGVVINYLVMKVIILVKTAPILAWAESRSLPIFPCNALSHLIRSWSGCGWLRGKRLQSHRMIIISLCTTETKELCLYQQMEIDFFFKSKTWIICRSFTNSQKCTNVNF